ncbi:MAG: family 78 glycoside hydrolase catalytic domain [Hymenobacter sp.]|nr:family 78 glycoside hydrolase catalytic domain [Hymenobacter sp.]
MFNLCFLRRSLIAGLLLLALLAASPGGSAAADLPGWTVAKITADYRQHPIDVDQKTPDISWVLTSTARNKMQAAYQVLIATNQDFRGAAVWNSGKVVSGQSAHVRPCSGVLQSNRDYWVKVTAWSKDGEEATNVASFSTAFLDEAPQWRAQWVGFRSEAPFVAWTSTTAALAAFVPDSAVANRSQYLRKQFTLRKPLQRARVFVSGLGIYELSINGKKVGDHVLAPARTRYPDRVLYEVFDVKDQLLRGDNALGIQLGNGWFNPDKKYQDWRMTFFGYPRAILQLQLRYTDGSEETIVTDPSWRAALGPVTFNSIYDGEWYDARLEAEGWDRPGFRDDAWQPAVLMPTPTARMQAHTSPPERVTETRKPVKTIRQAPGVTVYDMGQNFSGWTKIRVRGERGAVVTLHHAEDLKPDQTLDFKSNRSAKNTDRYVLKGGGDEVYEPRFTYHGFQYVEVAVQGRAEVLSAEGRVVHSDLAQTGVLETDNELINRIHHCTLWSQRSAFQGVPVDCPQRDERLGWLADGYVTADEAMLNFDGAQFYPKWLDDMRYAQDDEGRLPHIAPPTRLPADATNWSAGLFPVVWDYYRTYGDRELIAREYPAMQRYVAYMQKSAKGYILKADRYGDWGTPAQDQKATSGWVRGNPAASTTAMFCLSTDILAQSAAVLGKAAEARQYGQLRDSIGQVFNRTYFDEATSTYRGEAYHYQYLQGMPLFLNLAPEKNRAQVMTNLLKDIKETRQGHLYSGIIGTKYIVELLSREGRNDVVYQMVTAKGYPGWDFLTAGRNTFPEWWDRSGSHNHVMFGSIDAWFYRQLAGIQAGPAGEGYGQLVIRPYFPTTGLNKVRASIETMKGTVASSWQRTGTAVAMTVEIPVNTTAQVVLPAAATSLTLNQKTTKSTRSADGQTAFTLGSGSYAIAFRL